MESEPENVKELSYLLYLCHNCSLYSHVFWDSLQGIIINCSHVSLLHLTMSSFKVVSTFYLYYILSAYYSSWKKWLLLLETNMSNFKYVIVCSWMIDPFNMNSKYFLKIQVEAWFSQILFLLVRTIGAWRWHSFWWVESVSEGLGSHWNTRTYGSEQK